MDVISNAFELTKHTDGWWAVMWPEDRWRGIYDQKTKIKLAEILFGDIGCNQVAFAVKTEGGSYSTLWVDSYVFMMKDGAESIASLMSQYVVGGVKFPQQDQAEKLLKYLEKQYIWSILKQDPANIN